jgi:hypothetical protein
MPEYVPSRIKFSPNNNRANRVEQRLDAIEKQVTDNGEDANNGNQSDMWWPRLPRAPIHGELRGTLMVPSRNNAITICPPQEGKCRGKP